MQFSYNALGQEFLRQSQAGFANSSHYTATGLLAHQRAGRGTESFLQSLHDNPLQLPISTDVHRGYQYDKAFNLVNIDDARWNRTQYRYNANDQIVETQYSNQFVSWAGRLNTWGQMAFWQSHDDYADNDPEYTECHFRFAGQYEDKESGFNPYGYVHCPAGWVDPLGLAGSPYIFDSKQLQKNFKHAINLGVTDNTNKINIAKFEIAMKNHMSLSSTIKIKRQYRRVQDVYHYFNLETNLNVMIDMDGSFISRWKLSEKQTTDLLEKGNVF